MGMEKVSPARAANPKVLTCSTPCSPCPTEFIASHFRGGRLKPNLRKLIVGSWNVEGFTDTKLEELQNHMFHNHIGVLCLQETHRTVSEHYITDNGFLVILSGEEDGCFAGVGFIVAPHCRRCVVSFCPESCRQASLKLRVPGGKMVICSLYAPHSGKPFDERQTFFQATAEWMNSLSRHGPLLALGDFNARLHKRHAGESHLIGPHIFGNKNAYFNAESNRSLLLEMREALGLFVANTGFDLPVEKQVTVYNVGSSPAATLNSTNFGQIDFLLVGREWWHKILSVASCMDMSLASHHFPIIAEIDVELPKAIATTARDPRYHLSELQSACTSSLFATYFHECMLQCHCENGTADELCTAMATSFQQSAERCLHQTKRQARKPWISSRTLHLLEERDKARTSRNPHLEKMLHGKVKQSVKMDRSQWLDDLLKTGDWNEIRRLRKGHRPQSRRLKNADGNVVESDQRAETLANYFESVQWAPRATTEAPRSTCDDPLLVSNTSISEAEVVESVRSKKRRKAAGSDGIPPEFWKAICTYNSPACRWAVLLCNKVWTEGSVPTSWHEATVAAIFKKGDPACCGNYRPISLLAVGYKIFAAILLRRLKDAGAEDRIWPTQFGFRSGCGCADALFIARRKVENAWARKNGNLLLLALDWAKAFDSISPAGLVNAMSRFVIPYHFCSVVRGIYNGRHFIVRDGGVTSGQHPQCFGISQGCPLSPFLFSIVMTLLIQDAKAAFLSRRDPARTGEISELMYADDTLILASQQWRCWNLHAVHRTGWAYVWVATELEQIGSTSSAMWSTHQKTQWRLCGFERVVALFGKFLMWQWQYWAWAE